mmetsp:Transcript_296/g.965  ORF Transcript_296/g.965 Transcript_296/m.965 type:complete len:170 (+) Transcript_296:150-659(+)
MDRMGGALGVKNGRKVAYKVYHCPYPDCGKDFNRRYNLKIHIRVHTGETPYSCSREGCKKTFMWRSSLLHHTKLHDIKDGKLPASALEASSSSNHHSSRAISALEASDLDNISSREMSNLCQAVRQMSSLSDAAYAREISALSDDSCFSDFNAGCQVAPLPEGYEIMRF